MNLSLASTQNAIICWLLMKGDFCSGEWLKL